MLERDHDTQAFVTGMCSDIDKAETACQGLLQFVYLLKGEHDEYKAMIERLQTEMKKLAAINPAATQVACLKAEISLAEENLTTLVRNLQKLERILTLLPADEEEDMDGESEWTQRDC